MVWVEFRNYCACLVVNCIQGLAEPNTINQRRVATDFANVENEQRANVAMIASSNGRYDHPQ